MMARFRYRLSSKQVVGGHPGKLMKVTGDHQEPLGTEFVGLGNGVVTRLALRIEHWPFIRLVAS